MHHLASTGPHACCLCVDIDSQADNISLFALRANIIARIRLLFVPDNILLI